MSMLPFSIKDLDIYRVSIACANDFPHSAWGFPMLREENDNFIYYGCIICNSKRVGREIRVSVFK